MEGEFLSRPNELVVFFIDDQELKRLDPLAEDATESLRSAVLEYVDPTSGRKLFDEIDDLLKRWRRGSRDAAPPVLPFIALSVLAASNMQNEGEKRSTNYYYPFAKALVGSRIEDAEKLASILKQEQPSGVLQDSWIALDNWIREKDGLVGISSIRTSQTHSRIGFPISQALVRSSDRIALTRFFLDINILDNGLPSEEEIHQKLNIWVNDSRGLSTYFRKTLNDPVLSNVVTGVVHALASSWDGEVLSSDGLARETISIALDLDSLDIWGVLKDGNHPSNFSVETDSITIEFRMEFEEPRLFFGDIPKSVTLRELMAGKKFEGQGSYAEFKPAPVLIFRQDPYVGTWLSCNQIAVSEQYLIACTSNAERKVKRAVGTFSVGRSRLREFPPYETIFSGISIIEGIEFANESTALSFTQSLPVYLTTVSQHPVSLQPKLAGGLKVQNNLSSLHYFVGGEPDLVYPPNADGQRVEVVLDGARETFSENGGIIPLRKFNLPEGPHTVEVDGRLLRFTTGSSPFETRGTGSPSVDNRQKIQGFAPETSNKAVYPDPSLKMELDENEPILVRRRQERTIGLYADGTSKNLVEPDKPIIDAVKKEKIISTKFEINPEPGLLWIGQRRGGSWTVREANAARTKCYSVDADIEETWRVYKQKRFPPEMWILFLEAGKVR